MKDLCGHCAAATVRLHWVLVTGFLAVSFLAQSCARGWLPGINQAIGKPTQIAPGSSQELTFALVGDVSDANVWALFDGRGYSYNNYAVRAEYWPRLYRLTTPDQRLEPMAATGSPQAVQAEGAFYAATIPLRTDLRWSDGMPFTAEDVAFTVNTVLRFELDYDWHSFLNPQILDHAEAVGPDAVKFLFKLAPGVAEWQYGVLQAPIVQESYWSAKVTAASASLPSNELLGDIAALQQKVADLQQRVDALHAETFTVQPAEARSLQEQLQRQQGNLDEATNDLARMKSEALDGLRAAQEALVATDDDGEPLLGRWLPAARSSSSGAAGEVLNVVNPALGQSQPAFNEIRFAFYADAGDAQAALERGEVAAVLDPDPEDLAAGAAGMVSPTRQLRMLVLNTSGALRDTTLRRAIACMLDHEELQTRLGNAALPLRGFVLEGDAWWDAAVSLPCAGYDGASRLSEAVSLLRSAGYAWAIDPTPQAEGRGLQTPDGTNLPTLDLLVSSADSLRMSAATYVEDRMHQLGIPSALISAQPDAVTYAVFSSGDYDLAVMGWDVSTYPRYLCDWFGADGDFRYQPSTSGDLCGRLATTSDLDTAHSLMTDLQRVLSQDLPMIPLYSGVARESLHGISYPFTSIAGGLAGVYGAPELAFAAAP